MHDQHVLSLEGFFLPRAFLPTANKALLVGVYVIVVDMFHEIILVWGEIHVRLMWIRPSLSLRYTDSDNIVQIINSLSFSVSLNKFKERLNAM